MGSTAACFKDSKKDWSNPSLMEDNNGEGPRPLKVTFSGPDEHWTDAIPIGNGRLGAMIWGGFASETLQLHVSPQQSQKC
ncbi:hypothetical protein OIU77_028766 [Salix suchowensis]|uniref:Glycosyl hydrolase family 95 N-terminal domain-containing protein n=1 Tax=Salix suchowensis TaxID=1278906 RepID=A0ABQ9BKB5_9ROSI|nr:hypothetical protein OIU77_028766 [Salix suchowensis]